MESSTVQKRHSRSRWRIVEATLFDPLKSNFRDDCTNLGRWKAGLRAWYQHDNRAWPQRSHDDMAPPRNTLLAFSFRRTMVLRCGHLEWPAADLGGYQTKTQKRPTTSETPSNKAFKRMVHSRRLGQRLSTTLALVVASRNAATNRRGCTQGEPGWSSHRLSASARR